MKYCDLHCHSFFSDGTKSPEELVDLACESGISALALTDHNTIAGLERFFAAAEGRIEACGGCEFTTEDNGQELHLLGLCLTPDKLHVIQDSLDAQQKRKVKSNKDTLARMAADGYDVSYQEFHKVTGDQIEEGSKNRVHIARYLIHKGLVANLGEAFDGFLSESGKYYRRYSKSDFYEMIATIKKAGGVAVWAHPLFHVNRDTCEVILQKGKAAGLDGAEVMYTTYTEDDTAFMKAVCEKYKLLPSGGSDFHGENKPDVLIGVGHGNLRIPYDFYQKLKSLKR